VADSMPEAGYGPGALTSFYNLARVRQTLCVTPAMEAVSRITLWSAEQIVRLLEAR
jgi:hypothetical protein